MAKKKALVVPESVANKVLLLDCREEGSIRKLKQFLNKLPFIKSEEDLQTDNLEIIIKKLEKKSNIRLSYIMRSNIEGKELYSGMLKTDGLGSSNNEWLKTIYAITVWETLAKTVFYMYYHITNQKKE